MAVMGGSAFGRGGGVFRLYEERPVTTIARLVSQRRNVLTKSTSQPPNLFAAEGGMLCSHSYAIPGAVVEMRKPGCNVDDSGTALLVLSDKTA